MMIRVSYDLDSFINGGLYRGLYRRLLGGLLRGDTRSLGNGSCLPGVPRFPLRGKDLQGGRCA